MSLAKRNGLWEAALGVSDAVLADSGPRLTRYTQMLFGHAPSIRRGGKTSRWAIYADEWQCRDIAYVSAGAYLATADDPFHGLRAGSGLDMQIGVEFHDGGRRCTLHLRGDTDAGRALVTYLAALPNWGSFVTIDVRAFGSQLELLW